LRQEHFQPSLFSVEKGLTLRDFRKISQVLYYCLLEQELTQLAINYSFNSSKLNCTVLKLRWWTRRCTSSTSPLCPSIRPQETSLSTATRSSSGSSMLPLPTLISSSHLTRRLHSRLRGPGRAKGGAVEQVWRHSTHRHVQRPSPAYEEHHNFVALPRG
jgi:hypothetical protein